MVPSLTLASIASASKYFDVTQCVYFSHVDSICLWQYADKSWNAAQHFFVIVWFIILLILFILIYLKILLSETPVRTEASQTLHNVAIHCGLC